MLNRHSIQSRNRDRGKRLIMSRIKFATSNIGALMGIIMELVDTRISRTNIICLETKWQVR